MNRILPREVMWQFLDCPGLEILALHENVDNIRAASVLTRSIAGSPVALHYGVECDRGWRTRFLRAEVTSNVRRTLTLHGDGAGVWTDDDGEVLVAISGCIDVDVSATPFTNTLPIRRLELQPGDEATIDAAFVNVPELTLHRSIQRYTCLERAAEGARYRYESLRDGLVGYTTEITVDRDGLVVEYPDYARRIVE